MNMKIGVALLSFAHNHQIHWAKSFIKDSRVRIVGAWDSDYQRGKDGATVFNIPFCSDLDTLLSDRSVGAVAICSETDCHAELAIAAAKAGKHILCEKPMAVSLEQCQLMKDAAAQTGVIYMQAFPQRQISSNIFIKRLLLEEKIGRVSLIRKRHGHYFGLEGLGQKMPWIVNKYRAGAGGFFDEGIHECDVLRWYFGDPISVTAMVGNSITEIAELGIDDFGAAIFRFPQGEIAVLESGWGWKAGGPTTEIYGNQGTIIQSLTDCTSNAAPLPGIAPLQIARANNGQLSWEQLNCADDFTAVHEVVASTFVDCLCQGGFPTVTAADGLKALEMMLGVYLAAEEGRTIQFPLDEKYYRLNISSIGGPSDS